MSNDLYDETSTSAELLRWWNGQMVVHRPRLPEDYHFRTRLEDVTEVMEYDCD